MIFFRKVASWNFVEQYDEVGTHIMAKLKPKRCANLEENSPPVLYILLVITHL